MTNTLLLLDHIAIDLIAVLFVLRALRRRHHQPRPRITGFDLLVNRQGADVPLQIRDNQQVRYAISETDAAGNPVDQETAVGVPDWSLDAGGEEIVELIVDEGGFGALVVARGPLGNAVVNVSVTLPDDRFILGSDVVSVISDDVASQVTLTAGEPEDQPVVDPGGE